MAPKWPLALVPLGVVAVVLLGTLATACGKEFPLCKAGEYRACTCSDGAAGYQQCVGAEDDFNACVCGGGTPGIDAGAPTPKGDKGYLASCASGAECQSGLCGSFPSRGDKCTIKCTTNAECAAPSPGCNPQQICRSP